MEKLSPKKRVTIVRQYLSGLSYDEIAAKDGVSKGTVANVVTELKAGVFPEAADVGEQVELLRELALDFKRSNFSAGQCAIGLAVLNRITECGLSPADIDRWPVILRSAGGDDEAQEFVRLVYSIQEVQKRTGLSLDKLDDKAHDLERKAAELEPISRRHDTCTSELANLTARRGELAREVATLEQKYQLLNPRVKDMEKREKDLSRQATDMETRAAKAETILAALSKEKQRLLDIGLSVEALGAFNERLQSIAQRHHIAPAELRDRLLQELGILGEGTRLETLVQARQRELGEQERAVALVRQEETNLKGAIDSLKQEKTSLEASIKNTREKVGAELAKMVPVARGAINGVVQELRRGHNEVLEEVRRLRDEATEAGKEIGKLEEVVKTNQWLGDLLALARGDENLEAKLVRAITILVLRGAAVWIRRHKANDAGLYSLAHATDSLVKEMEQWKV